MCPRVLNVPASRWRCPLLYACLSLSLCVCGGGGGIIRRLRPLWFWLSPSFSLLVLLMLSPATTAATTAAHLRILLGYKSTDTCAQESSENKTALACPCVRLSVYPFHRCMRACVLAPSLFACQGYLVFLLAYRHGGCCCRFPFCCCRAIVCRACMSVFSSFPCLFSGVWSVDSLHADLRRRDRHLRLPSLFFLFLLSLLLFVSTALSSPAACSYTVLLPGGGREIRHGLLHVLISA